MEVRCMECLAIFVKSDFLHFVGGFPLGKSGAESNAPKTWYGVLTNALHLVRKDRAGIVPMTAD